MFKDNIDKIICGAGVDSLFRKHLYRRYIADLSNYPYIDKDEDGNIDKEHLLRIVDDHCFDIYYYLNEKLKKETQENKVIISIRVECKNNKELSNICVEVCDGLESILKTQNLYESIDVGFAENDIKTIMKNHDSVLVSIYRSIDKSTNIDELFKYIDSIKDIELLDLEYLNKKTQSIAKDIERVLEHKTF